MAILGDYTKADKFYIINSQGNIEWVPSLKIAEKYSKNPEFTEWYNKDIYATDEEFVVLKNGKTVFKSQAEEEELKLSIIDILNDFKEQAKTYMDSQLTTFSLLHGYKNIQDMFSWINSDVKNKKEDAKTALKYRDKLYLYTEEYELKVNKKLLENKNDFDLTEEYFNYMQNFPKID